MTEVQRARIVLKILNKTYPRTPIPLKHRNIFTLLISVLLSAQCTDVNVNNVTKWSAVRAIELKLGPFESESNFKAF